MRDIVQKIGENFARVRIGVGRPQYGDLAYYVLSTVSNDNLKILDETFGKAEKALKYFISKKSVEGLDINKL